MKELMQSVYFSSIKVVRLAFQEGYGFDQKGGPNVVFLAQKAKTAAKTILALSIFDNKGSIFDKGDDHAFHRHVNAYAI